MEDTPVPAKPPQAKANADAEELEQLVEQLMGEMAQLRGERDAAIKERDLALKARDALLDKVIPLAVPGGLDGGSTSGGKASKVLMLVLCVLLLTAVFLMAHHFPRIVQALDSTKDLPPSVHVRER